METQKRQCTAIACHGADRMYFARFGIAAMLICNVGPHFGAKFAAKKPVRPTNGGEVS